VSCFSKLAQSIRRLSYVFLSISIVLFVSAIASVLFLGNLGMYLSLALVVVGSFTMLLTNLLREKNKRTSIGPRELKILNAKMKEENEARIS
jgi:hypothetical protein